MIAITPMPPTINAMDEITTSARNVAWLTRFQSFNTASCVTMSKSSGSSSRSPCRIRMIRSTSSTAVCWSTPGRGSTEICIGVCMAPRNPWTIRMPNAR